MVPRAERDAAVSRLNLLLRYYRIILRRGPRNIGSLPLPAGDRYSARTRGTRVKISPVMHVKFGHGRLPLPRSEHADPTRNIINSRLPDDRTR